MKQLEWMDAPESTGWGCGMKVATVELSRDETADIYGHQDALPLVEAAFAALFEKKGLTIKTNFHINGPLDDRTRDQLAAAVSSAMQRNGRNL